MSVRRTGLDVLTRPRLREVGRKVGIEFYAATSRADMLDSISRSYSVPLKDLLLHFNRNELKLACQRLDLDETGRERQVLIKRILAKDLQFRRTKSQPKSVSRKRKIETTRVSHSRGTSSFLHGVNDMDEPKVISQPATSDVQEEHSRVELVWPGKRREVDRVVLPFQCIEIVNETRATREAEKALPMLKTFKAGEQPAQGTDWRNKLIWGDNKYVLGSLLEQYAGQIDLIYIDPPFATGQDFSFQLEVGGTSLVKEASLIEEKAYRDTWGRGITSFLQMLAERLTLMRQLLSPRGSLFVHIGSNVSHYVRMLLEDLFGTDNFRNEIILPGRAVKNLQQQFQNISRLQVRHDTLLWVSRSPEMRFAAHWVEKHDAGNPEGHWHHAWSTADRPTMRYKLLGVKPSTGQWVWSEERALQAVANYVRFEKESGGRSLAEYWRDTGCKLEFIRPDPKDGKPQYWRAPAETRIGDTVWSGIPIYSNSQGYPTEKNEKFLEEVIRLASDEGDLVADFFCGSGTTMAVAERMGRKWIGCDLGRWSLQVTRKRLMDLEDCNPFELLNLGRYERQHWQGVTFGKGRDHIKALHEYVRFVLDLYRAEPTSGLTHIHGQRGGFMIHVGAADSPVTLSEIRDAVDECKKIKQTKLDILGWEWEMGLHDVVEAESKGSGVKLRLLQIPRECMDQRAVDAGDVHFYELAYLEAESERRKGAREVRITLKNFVIPNPELIPDDVRSKVKKWSDFIDYWSVDFEFNEDVFHNQWQDYRTRSKRDLELTTDWHEYPKGGAYKVLVKVFDIFGNDTTQLLEVKV